MTLSLGMRADYASLIDKHQGEGLRLTPSRKVCTYSYPALSGVLFRLAIARSSRISAHRLCAPFSAYCRQCSK